MNNVLTDYQNCRLTVRTKWDLIWKLMIIAMTIPGAYATYHEFSAPSANHIFSMTLFSIYTFGAICLLFTSINTIFLIKEKVVIYKFSIFNIGITREFPFEKLTILKLIRGGGGVSPRHPVVCLLFNSKKYTIASFLPGKANNFISKLSQTTGIPYTPPILGWQNDL